jgi:hypothetical protein
LWTDKKVNAKLTHVALNSSGMTTPPCGGSPIVAPRQVPFRFAGLNQSSLLSHFPTSSPLNALLQISNQTAFAARFLIVALSARWVDTRS